MYALGMNTTKKVCVGLGQTDEEGKKFAKFDDIVEKVMLQKPPPTPLEPTTTTLSSLSSMTKTTPDASGTYHDYIELLKLYDKNHPRLLWNLPPRALEHLVFLRRTAAPSTPSRSAAPPRRPSAPG